MRIKTIGKTTPQVIQRGRRAIMTGAITGNTLISCHRHREEREGESSLAVAWCLSARGELKCKNDRRHFFIAGD